MAGDPGIGKSTLLLQAAAAFANAGLKVVYISGEEASAQIRLRAQRLNLAEAPVKLATETNLRDILTTLDETRPDLAIIDSVQTMWADNVDSTPGSVSQVRAAAHELTTFAKSTGSSIMMVGHVTKEGQLAGPRVVEHMVDTVLYFEGERGHQFRILRAVKNRFGPADEIGVFEMTGKGLAEVTNPSALFLSERGQPSPGSVVFAGIEGTRPLLVELQALVSPSPHSQPRRSVVGWDGSRLAMILAVLESRCGIPFAGLDVYLNVAGGCGSANLPPIWLWPLRYFPRARTPPCPRYCRFRRNQPIREPASRRPVGKPIERGAETWFLQGDSAARGQGHGIGRHGAVPDARPDHLRRRGLWRRVDPAEPL